MISKYNNFINESNNGYSNIEILLGKTLTDVVKYNGDLGDSIVFTVDDGSEYVMYHEQDCCEYVTIDDINGDLEDLVGSPILKANMITNSDRDYGKSDESFTWTFYKLATIKGYVVFRWFGTSNGYYSEEVEFYQVK